MSFRDLLNLQKMALTTRDYALLADVNKKIFIIRNLNRIKKEQRLAELRDVAFDKKICEYLER